MDAPEAADPIDPVPENCTTCGTAIPRGAPRCPGCGKVFGEANRCPSCHAVAAVTSSPLGYVCLACGGPRQLLPGTTVIDSGPMGIPRPSRPPAVAPESFEPPESVAASTRRVPLVRRPSSGRPMALRAAGVLLLALGAAGAAASVALTGGTAGLILAAAAGGAGAGLGGLFLRAGGKAAERTRREHSAQMEQAVLALAVDKGGVLSVTEVARGLGVTVAEADDALTSIADGSRVSAEITTDGLLLYHFRELEARARVRVDVGVEEEAEVEVEEGDQDRRARR